MMGQDRDVRVLQTEGETGYDEPTGTVAVNRNTRGRRAAQVHEMTHDL